MLARASSPSAAATTGTSRHPPRPIPSAVQAASLVAAEGYDRTGVLSPATAFDATGFLDALGDHGLTYELDLVAEPAAA